MVAAAKSARFEILVNRDWCKGCSICVAFCPAEVLGLDGDEKAVVLRAADCTGCRLCELRCPDFAVEVRPAGQPVRVAKEGGAAGEPEGSEAGTGSGDDD